MRYLLEDLDCSINEGRSATVGYEGIRVYPFLIEVLSCNIGCGLDITATLRRTAVLPNALGNERILLVDGVLTMSGESIDDDLGIRL